MQVTSHQTAIQSHSNLYIKSNTRENPDNSSYAALLMALFDNMAHGIWIVDANANLHYANTIAQHITHAARCLQVQNGQLITAQKSDQSAFIRVIQKATQISQPGHCLAARSVMRLRVIDTRPPTEMFALVTPLQPLCDGAQSGLAAIQLQQTTLIDPSMLCMVARNYQLTSREELVLGLLCDGLDAPEIATTLNVAVSTIRTHVRGLCTKMQVQSIRQMVIKMALLPGVAGLMHVV